MLAKNIDNSLSPTGIFGHVWIPHAMRGEFAEAEFDRKKPLMRVTALCGLVFSMSFLGFDLLLIPDVIDTAIVLRCVVGPLVVAAYLAIIEQCRLPVWGFDIMSGVLIVAATLVLSYLVTISRSETVGIYVNITSVPMIMVCILLEPPMKVAAIAALFTLSIVAIATASSPNFDYRLSITNLAVAASLFLPTLYANWYMRNERRRRFLSSARDRLRLRVLSRQNGTLEQLSNSDPLTGLANRRAFEARLRETVEEARSRGGLVAVAMIDIDFFKRYNDRYGHPAGDACLRRVAAAISAASKGRDFAARLGGEEFAVILTSGDPRLLTLAGERIRLGVEQLALPHEGIDPAGHVSISVGIGYAVPDTAVGWADETLLADADRALYAAKHSGRNRVRVNAELLKSSAVTLSEDSLVA